MSRFNTNNFIKSQPYQCDSSYILKAAFINGSGIMREYCKGGMILCEVMPIDNTCHVGGYSSKEYQYKWYRKIDPAKFSLGFDEFIEVDKKDDYCCDITITGRLDVLSKKCTFTICDQFNEDDLRFDKICPKGDSELCVGNVGIYSVDTISSTGAKHIWTVSGGVILTQNPIEKKSIEVLWNFDPSPNKYYEGQVCYQLVSDCPETSECCLKVKVNHNQGELSGGPDVQVRGLNYKLNAEPNYSGKWTMVKGPGNAFFNNVNDSKTSVKVSSFGTYTFRWTISCGVDYSDDVNINFYRFKVISGGTGAEGRDSCCIPPENISHLTERSMLRNYSIVPNPIHDRQFQILGGELETSSELKIYDLQGRKIFESKFKWTSFSQKIELNPDTKSGIYCIRIQDEDANYWMEKLVVFD